MTGTKIKLNKNMNNKNELINQDNFNSTDNIIKNEKDPVKNI